MKFALFLAPGYEEGEAVLTADIIRRSGQVVDIVSVGETKSVKSAHDITIVADWKISDIKYEDYDGFILPGGMPGTLNLKKSEALKEMIVQANSDKKIIAAICAAPTVLDEWGILDNRQVACYPSCVKDIHHGAANNEAAAITDGHIITGASVGSVINFGLAIVDKSLGNHEVLILQEQLVIRD